MKSAQAISLSIFAVSSDLGNIGGVLQQSSMQSPHCFYEPFSVAVGIYSLVMYPPAAQVPSTHCKAHRANSKRLKSFRRTDARGSV
jgi:hypothetical protein